MIRFLDSKENLISKAGDGTVMSFHSRIMINPGLGVPLEEGTRLIIFTEENFKKLQDYNKHNTEELIRLNKECLRMADMSGEYMDKLIKENDDLKRLNLELTKKINKLREEG